MIRHGSVAAEVKTSVSRLPGVFVSPSTTVISDQDHIRCRAQNWTQQRRGRDEILSVREPGHGLWARAATRPPMPRPMVTSAGSGVCRDRE